VASDSVRSPYQPDLLSSTWRPRLVEGWVATASGMLFTLRFLLQLPLSLLTAAIGQPMVNANDLCVRDLAGRLFFILLCECLQLIELKNGDTYNGNLVNCDSWMNINLRDVICTSKVGWLDPLTLWLRRKPDCSACPPPLSGR
jgi:hypothetical protein